MKTGFQVALSLAMCGGIAAACTFWTLGDQARAQEGAPVAPGLVIPHMDPMNGKKLFASKGCVVCHQVHGIGGTDSPSLDITTMDPVMSPFDFFAKMWRGASAMIEMQNKELGGQVEFTGQELADIVAFLHSRRAEQTFTEADIPDNIKKLMEGDDDKGDGGMMGGGGMKGGNMMGK